MTIWSILLPFGIFCGNLVHFYGHLVYFCSRFGMLYKEKSGNPAPNSITLAARQNELSPGFRFVTQSISL
jgi:hypothetical protein